MPLHKSQPPHGYRCCGAGTGPQGLHEVESGGGWGVSLSLVHLPPGVQLLPYYRAEGTMTLQHGANEYSGAPHVGMPVHVRPGCMSSKLMWMSISKGQSYRRLTRYSCFKVVLSCTA